MRQVVGTLRINRSAELSERQLIVGTFFKAGKDVTDFKRNTLRERERKAGNDKALVYVLELEVASVTFECALHKCIGNLQRGVVKFLMRFHQAPF